MEIGYIFIEGKNSKHKITINNLLRKKLMIKCLDDI